MLAACSSSVDKPKIVQDVDRLVAMYPNYRSNEIARAALLDSVTNYPRTIGQYPAELAGVKFKFKKLVDNPQTGGRSALFVSDCTSDIENPGGSPKYLSNNIDIRVLGVVADDVAARLDAGQCYAVDGVLRAWDAEDVFFVTSSIGYSLDFGTYILDDMSVKPFEE